MFLAWNEIRRNKLKFGLIIGVLTMISYLLFLLSGLANGLINMNKEGIDKWQADAIVLNKDANQTVQQSVFNKKDIENKYKKQATLKQTGEIVSNGHQKDNVLVFGVEKSSFLVPSLIEGHKATKDNEVLADETLKNKGFKIGDTLSLSQSDEKLHIVGFTESAKYNASSVIFTNDATIAKINPRLTGDKINAVVVRDTNWKDKKLNQELEAVSINDFIENLPGYKPQNIKLYDFILICHFSYSYRHFPICHDITKDEFIWHIKSSRIYEWLFGECGNFADGHISTIWYGIWLTVNRRYRCIFT